LILLPDSGASIGDSARPSHATVGLMRLLHAGGEKAS
jgi:hypothetical protein